MQGDHSGCVKPPVELKTNVLFQYEANVLKHNLCFGVNGRFGTTCRKSVAAPQFLDIIYLGHYNGLLSYIRFLMLLLFLQVNCKIYGSFLIHISWFLLLRRSRRLRRPSTTLTRTTTASSPRQSFEKSSIVSAKRSGIQMCSRESGS